MLFCFRPPKNRTAIRKALYSLPEHRPEHRHFLAAGAFDFLLREVVAKQLLDLLEGGAAGALRRMHHDWRMCISDWRRLKLIKPRHACEEFLPGCNLLLQCRVVLHRRFQAVGACASRLCVHYLMNPNCCCWMSQPNNDDESTAMMATTMMCIHMHPYKSFSGLYMLIPVVK